MPIVNLNTQTRLLISIFNKISTAVLHVNLFPFHPKFTEESKKSSFALRTSKLRYCPFLLFDWLNGPKVPH